MRPNLFSAGIILLFWLSVLNIIAFMVVFWGDILKRYLIHVLCVLAASVLASCTDDRVYRSTFQPIESGDRWIINGDSGPLCHSKMPLIEAELSFPDALCFHQTYAVASSTERWSDLAQTNGHTLRNHEDFDLYFLEMLEDRELTNLNQRLPVIRRELATQDQSVVVVFVHGWRHNADIGNENVETFRMLLAYTRSFLNARCVENGTYCDAKLSGLFLSWRGAIYEEPTFGGLLDSGVASATAFNRSVEADRLSAATPIGGGTYSRSITQQIIDYVDGSLNLDNTSLSHDKMLVVGHSFGGHLIANSYVDEAVQAVAEHEYRGLTEPIVGDLLVLFNPASPLENWKRIQEQIRRQSCLPSSVPNVQHAQVEGTEPKDVICADDITAAMVNQNESAFLNELMNNNIRNFRRRWPDQQRPIYMSLTSTGNIDLGSTLVDGVRVPRRGRPLARDWATKALFPIMRFVRFGQWNENSHTFGHTLPDYDENRRVRAHPYGATHEISIANGLGIPVSMLNASQPQTAWCSTAGGTWLLNSRQAAHETNSAQRSQIIGDAKRLATPANITSEDTFWWDTHWSSGKRVPTMPLDLRNAFATAAGEAPHAEDLGVQIRQAIYLQTDSTEKFESAAPAGSPFWNMRATDHTVTGHGGFENYPLWCNIHQVWLDDIVGTSRQ